jgi:hypothetical protein
MFLLCVLQKTFEVPHGRQVNIFCSEQQQVRAAVKNWR